MCTSCEISLAHDQTKDGLWRTAKLEKVAVPDSKQLSEVQNMTGESAEKRLLAF